MPGNGAEAALAVLSQAGVNSIYGVSGDAIFPLLDAISRQDSLNYYGVTHECNAAFMASYEARMTGLPAVCTATSGPGTANLLNGLADAYYERVPVLAITGQVDTTQIGTKAKQYFRQNEVLQAFTGFSETVVSIQALIPVLQEAVQTAVERKTVAHVAIPRDIFLQPVEAKLPCVSTGHSHTIGGGIAGELETAVNTIKQAKQLMVVLGTRERDSAAAVLSLAEKVTAGIITAQQAKGVVSDDEPKVIGGIGEGYLPEVVNKADCWLVFGQAPFEMKFIPSGVPLVQFAGEAGELNYSRLTCGITGKTGLILKALHERLPRAFHPDWQADIEQERQRRKQLVSTDAQNNESPIHPARLIAALNSVLEEDAVIIEDIGSFVHWFERGFRAKRHTILTSAHWRSMGAGLPAAIGARVAAPDRQVVALVGDGGFLMSMPELLTAVKYSLSLTVIVVNNHGYVLERQKAAFENLTPFGNELRVPNLVEFAHTCGAQGFGVDRPEELEITLTNALACKEPAVVDVRVADKPLPFMK